jgi:hypothetical protein
MAVCTSGGQAFDRPDFSGGRTSACSLIPSNPQAFGSNSEFAGGSLGQFIGAITTLYKLPRSRPRCAARAMSRIGVDRPLRRLLPDVEKSTTLCEAGVVQFRRIARGKR